MILTEQISPKTKTFESNAFSMWTTAQTRFQTEKKKVFLQKEGVIVFNIFWKNLYKQHMDSTKQ